MASGPATLVATSVTGHGCSYRRLPSSMGLFRNPMGAIMGMRTRVALDVEDSMLPWGARAASPRVRGN